MQQRIWSKLDNYQRLNLNLKYDFDRFGELTLGVNNLKDSMPPLYAPGHPSRNVFPYFEEDAGYNTVGRVFFVGYEYKL